MSRLYIYAAIIVLIIAAASISVYSWFFLVPPIRKGHLRIGYQPSTHQIAYMTAMKKGWWLEDLKTFGVTTVSDYEFPSGPPEMTAMMVGELDIAYVGATPPITAIDKGLDAKIVAGVQIQGSALALRPPFNNTYTDPNDLIGLTVATFSPGSIQDTVLKKWLMDNDITVNPVVPSTGVTFSPMGSGDAILAIKAKAVDGVFLPHPGPAIVELEDAGSIVVDSGEMWLNHTCCCLLVSGTLIREYPEMVKEIIRIHIKATEYNIAHVDEAAEIFAEKVGWEVDDVKYSLNTWDGIWVHNPHVGLSITLDYAQVHYDLGYTDNLLTEVDLFDTSFYDEVIHETQQMNFSPTESITQGLKILIMDVSEKWLKKD